MCVVYVRECVHGASLQPGYTSLPLSGVTQLYADVGAPACVGVASLQAYVGGAFVKCWLTSLVVGGVSADESTSV